MAPLPSLEPTPEILAPMLPIAAIELLSKIGIAKIGATPTIIAVIARKKLALPPDVLNNNVETKLPAPITNPTIGNKASKAMNIFFHLSKKVLVFGSI